jgi:hypothetical protein
MSPDRWRTRQKIEQAADAQPVPDSLNFFDPRPRKAPCAFATKYGLLLNFAGDSANKLFASAARAAQVQSRPETRLALYNRTR